MATKDHFFKDKQQYFVNGNSNIDNENQNFNLNLNQNHKCSILIPIQSFCKSETEKYYDSTVSDILEGRRKIEPWNKTSVTKSSLKKPNFVQLNGEFCKEGKKRWKKSGTFNSNSSTLSLHISAYENSIEAESNYSFGVKNKEGMKNAGLIKKLENTKQVFISSAFQNPFEFSRQQNDKVSEPEISEFKASQRLLHPNKTTSNGNQDGKVATHQQNRNLQPMNTPIYIRLERGINFVRNYDELRCCQSLIKKLKFNLILPTPLEKIVLPLGLDGNDMVVQAKNGSGKIACFATIAAHVAYSNNFANNICIIIAPEPKDVYEIEVYIKSLIDSPICTMGGDNKKDTRPILGYSYPVVIATPEILGHFVRVQMMSMINVKLLIVSKAEEYTNDVIEKHINVIVNSFKNAKVQIGLFSNGEAKNVYEYFANIISKPILVKLGVEESVNIVADDVAEKASVADVNRDSEAESKKDEVEISDDGENIGADNELMKNEVVDSEVVEEDTVPQLPVDVQQPLFDFAVIEFEIHPKDIISKLLSEIEFSQIMIFVDKNALLCDEIFEALQNQTYKCGIISNEMGIQEIENTFQALKDENIQILISRNVPMYNDVQTIVDLTINVGGAPDYTDYMTKNNQDSGAAITIFSTIEDLEKFISEDSFGDLDIRCLQISDIPDNLTTNTGFFANSPKLKELYNMTVEAIKEKIGSGEKNLGASESNPVRNENDENRENVPAPSYSFPGHVYPPAILDIEKAVKLCPDLRSVLKGQQQPQQQQQEQKQQQPSSSSAAASSSSRVQAEKPIKADKVPPKQKAKAKSTASNRGPIPRIEYLNAPSTESSNINQIFRTKKDK